jgi:transcriptional regulator with GAF, ATPase, and Fis domain
MPPLRKRRDDIPLLIYHFLRKFGLNTAAGHIPAEVMDKLEQYDWPGNVRELENIIHRYVVLNRMEVFNSFFWTGAQRIYPACTRQWSQAKRKTAV